MTVPLSMFEVSEFLIKLVYWSHLNLYQSHHSSVYTVKLNQIFHSTFSRQYNFCTKRKKKKDWLLPKCVVHELKDLHIYAAGTRAGGQAATEGQTGEHCLCGTRPEGGVRQGRDAADSIKQNGHQSHYFRATPCGMFIKYFFHKLKAVSATDEFNFSKINEKILCSCNICCKDSRNT